MPTIPIYDSKQTLAPQTRAPLKRGEATENANIRNNIINAVTDVTQQWSKAHDTIQATKATAEYEVGLAKIENEASKDQNYNNSQKYTKDLDDLKNGILQGIDNKQLMNEIAISFDKSNAIAGLKINNDFRQKEIADGRVNLQTSIDALINKKLDATTTAEAREYNEAIKDLIEANVATGIVTPEQANKMWHTSHVTAAEYDIYRDEATSKEGSVIYKELQDKEGKYKDLTPDERLALIKKSENKIAENEKLLKKLVQEQEIFSLEEQLKAQQEFENKIERTPVGIALDKIDEGMQRGIFSEKWGKSRKAAILSTAGINETSRNEFEANIIMDIETIGMSFDPGKKSRKKGYKNAAEYLRGVHDIEIKINNALASGSTTDKTAQALRKKLYTDTTAEATAVVAKKDKKGYGAADAFKNVFEKQLPLADSYMAVREYFNLTEDEKMSQQDGAKLALQIADRIKQDNRVYVLEENDKIIEEQEPSFATEEEALSAGLPEGTIVRIGGRRARL